MSTLLRPQLPGQTRKGQRIPVCVYEVELEGLGIHTRRHFAGVLQTHPFFSRQAIHAALWDLWSEVSPEEPEEEMYRYGATPLWADHPQILEIRYSSPRAAFSQDKARDRGFLTLGTMEAMAPGTRLIGALWGDEAEFPPVFVDRAFWIGKGRAPARVVACTQQMAEVQHGRLADHSIPVQIGRDLTHHPKLRAAGQKPLADTPGYRVVRIARGSEIPHLQCAGYTIPLLDLLDA